MKTIAKSAVMAVLIAFAAGPAGADVTCLQTRMIDHTSVQDSRTVLFHMKDGKTWRNTLTAACPSLRFHGFAVNLHRDEICSRGQSISVLETHEVCMLGQFSPEPAHI
jgi:hypothetical protein